MRLRFFTLLMMFGFQAAMAGTTGKIAGHVQDKSSGEPLVGVNIYLENTVLGATTDVNGDYVILNIPPGKYTVIAQYIGYHEVRMEGVQISIDRTTTLDFDLSEETMELESAIVVQAQRDLIQKDLTSSKAVVSSEQIESLPVVEMSDVLQLQPGVSRGANGEFHIRGGRSSEIAYQVNGVSISDAYDGSQAVDIDNNSIQEIEVISGTFPAEYGNAMSGVVNAVTKEGSQTFEGNMQVFTGDYLSNFTDYFFNIDNFNPVQDYSLRGSLSGPIARNLTFFLTTRYNYTDGYLYGTRKFSVTGDTLVARRPDGTFENGAIVPMNWSKNWTGQGKLTFTPTGTLKLTSEFLFSRRNFQDYDHNLKYAPD
ncbi:MAG TPA: TonB-dependent receptor, partial [Caldithrix abyssi]|nr:TonB-dependent receptor [Caldithrix abyssi]